MRAFNFGTYGLTRPAETSFRTAVPCILLTRKCSPGHLDVRLAACIAGSRSNRNAPLVPEVLNSFLADLHPELAP
jgi:hypothetical protein